MRSTLRTALLAASLSWLLGACAPAPILLGGPDTGTALPPRPSAPPGYPVEGALPLVLDRDATSFGVTRQYGRLPTTAEIGDLGLNDRLAQVVISLPAWPDGFEPLQPLARIPPSVDLLVVLPGWPPSREAANAWNLLAGHARVILVVPGPPPDRSVIADLNTMRALERVVAVMAEPVRTGFERLQRPLSFVVQTR